MNFKSQIAAVAAVVVAAFAVSGQPARAETASVELKKPMSGSTMFFADRYATAYYTVDNGNFRTVVTVAPAPNSKGNPSQFVNFLSDGETAEYSVGGFEQHATKVTLRLERTGSTVKAEIVADKTNS